MMRELSPSQIEHAFRVPLALPPPDGISWKFYLAQPQDRKALAIYFPEDREFICFPRLESEETHLVTSDPRTGAEFLHREHRPFHLSVHMVGELGHHPSWNRISCLKALRSRLNIKEAFRHQ
jgi:hypothetical protein